MPPAGRWQRTPYADIAAADENETVLWHGSEWIEIPVRNAG